MKKIIPFFIMICCLLAVSSCSYDNFEEPKATLAGKAIYDGEAVGVRSGSSEFALFQDGYALKGSIPVYIAQDGSYSVSLFNGDYKLVRMGNAPWERPSNDTIYPRDERLITIEDNAELRIRGIDNLVRLEAKMANMEGAVSVTIRDLIKSALRMRPDRIIVGEVRGGEAMDMLQALNTGHEGSLSTAHANSARDMLSRLETMVLMGVDLPLEAIRRQIASGVDILVHLGRMRDKSRKLLEVTEVCGFENGEIRIRPLYQWQEGKGLVKTASLLHVEKLERAGIEL